MLPTSRTASTSSTASTDSCGAWARGTAGPTVTLRYRFVHALYHNALYESLTPARRASLSGAVADAILSFCGEHTASVGSELALL